MSATNDRVSKYQKLNTVAENYLKGRGEKMKKILLITIVFVATFIGGCYEQFGGQYYPQPIIYSANQNSFLGNLSANRYTPYSTSNIYGAGNPYNPNSINNPYGKYGSPYSPYSVNNPYATNTPKLYDQQGNYRGKLSINPFDTDSISNPYGRYGSKYSPYSINNPYGAGSRYRYDSPNNPYGRGWIIKK